MRDALFAFIWAVMFPISLWSAHVGVLLWVWIALIAPGEQLYSIMAGIPYNKIVAISTIGVLILNRERKSFYVDATIVLLVLLALIGTVSASFSLADDPSNWDLYQKLLKIIVLAFIITGVMWSRHRLHMLLFVICLGYGFEAVSEGGQFLVTAGGHKVLGAASVGDNNQLAAAILMIVPLLYYLMKYSALRIVRLGMMAVITLSVFAVMGTNSRGGFLSMVLIALMFLRNSNRKIRGSLIIVALAGLAVLAAPASYTERLNTMNNVGEDSSFMERVTVWKVSTLIAIDRPLFGGGFHAVQTWPVWTAFTSKLPFLEFIDTPPPDAVPRAAHSSYFEVLGDLGFVGLAIFVGLLGVAMVNCARIRRLARDYPDLAWAADMAQMLQITFVVYMASTALLSMAYFECLYICLAVTSRLLRTVQETIAGTLPVEQQAVATSQSIALPAAARASISQRAA